MLKVFLVEDEYIVREGIKNNIDWKAHGYEFCGEAADGELAFPMIQKFKPDIVITDIKMPFMDGLTLSKLIKKELPWTEIIILTGHEEFEYAKEAIKLGVAQFLSKPIGGNELIKEIDALAQKIEEKRINLEMREKYKSEMEESLFKDRKSFFEYLVTNSKSIPELIEIAQQLKIDISASWYNIILLSAQSLKHGNNEYSKTVVKIEDSFKEIEKRMDIVMFDRDLEGNAFLIKGDSPEVLARNTEDFIMEVRTILDSYSNIRYFGGIGQPVNRLSELRFSFEKASRAFAHRHFTKDNRIIDSAKADNEPEMKQDEFDISNVDAKQIDREGIREFLKTGNKEEVSYIVEGFFGNLSSGAMKSNVFRQYITMDVYFNVINFLEDMDISKDEIEPIGTNYEVLKTSETAKSYVERIIGQALELRDRAVQNKHGSVVEDIMKYIDENYANEELSLNLIASHVNFSPNYLSMIFAQQTGVSFIKYLTDYRMNKAKELLRCSGKKSSEIAGEVGYKDPHYFSYLFKKTQNMTPTQYRGKKSAEGEE